MPSLPAYPLLRRCVTVPLDWDGVLLYAIFTMRLPSLSTRIAADQGRSLPAQQSRPMSATEGTWVSQCSQSTDAI